MMKQLLFILIVVLSFGGGFFLNEFRELTIYDIREARKNWELNQEIIEIPEEKIEKLEIINKKADKPEYLDFSIFWEVWNKIEEEHIGLKELDLRQQMLEGAIDGIIDVIEDEHTQFLNPEEADKFIREMEESFEGVGMHIRIEDGQLKVVAPLKGTPAYQEGILPSDKIIKIDGETTEGICLMEAVSLIRGPVNTEVVLTILRNNKEIEKKIIRGTIIIPTVELTFLNDGAIAHIEIFNFTKGTFDQVTEVAKEINRSTAIKIILDLRNNPGGWLHSAVNIAGLFLERNSIVVIQEKRGKRIISRTRGFGQPLLKEKEIIVLVNKGTASAAEILAGALRDNRNITLIGGVTVGKGSVQELKNLDDGSILKITTAYWLTPNRYKIEDKGLIPDIKVENKLEKLILGIDCQLQRAIEELKN